MIRRLFIASICLCFTSCVSSSGPGAPCDVQPFPEEFVQDEILLSEPYGIEDIAFTFPVFEIGAERTMESIKLRDAKIIKTKTSWTLLGDGAQPTVRFDLLSKAHENALKVRLTYGPVFQAYQDLPDPTFIYEFRRGSSGWHKLRYKRVFTTSSQQLFDSIREAEQAAPRNR